MNYKQIDEHDLAYFASFIEPDRILTGNQINEDYSHDELSGVTRFPEILIRVMTTNEVSRIMAYACDKNIPVVVRGSGTGLVGASVAICGGIMLETTLMNKILELDENNLTVTVQPGVLLMELAQYVEERGFLYPPDPGEKSATIGGNISTNAGGMRAVKYGVTREYVRGLTIVLPSGQVMNLGGKMVKNSSGYSLKDLIVGSEGTLAVVTEAIMRVIPKPGCSISLLVPFDDMQAVFQVVPEIVKSRSAPTAVEFMERQTILYAESFLGKKFPDNSSNYYLLLTYDGLSRLQVEADYEPVARLCLDHGARDVFLVDTDERKVSVWSARGAFLEAIKSSTSEMDECDVVVPRDRLAEFIRYTHQIAQEIGIRIPSFGHAGDGNLHVYICRDNLSDDIWKERLNQAFDQMYNKSVELAGLVSGEHGIGYAKRKYLDRQLGTDQKHLMWGIKQVFDPNNILNPLKIFTEADVYG